MPRLSANAAPKYRKHRASGQAVVTLNGKDHYLGPHGTVASRREYDRLIAEWFAHGRALTSTADLTVLELIAAYVRFARDYYRNSSEYSNILYSLRPLKELYADTLAVEFSPLKLKAVREAMIQSDLCRNEINKRIGRVKRLFRWAVENELLVSSVLPGLQAVRGLPQGRSAARETSPVKPVPEASIDALQPHLAPQLWAMIELQRCTGMRPGEVITIRTADLDVSGAVWVYAPVSHKTAWRGQQRQIYLGPRAQQVLTPWLRPQPEEFLFQPREADAWRRQRLQATRKTPLSCGNRAGTNRKANSQKTPGTCYTTRSYHQAVRKACAKAGVPPWHPHQLRHNAATWLRKEFGLEVARVVLGHRSPQITELYAELDREKAKQVMGQIG